MTKIEIKDYTTELAKGSTFAFGGTVTATFDNDSTADVTANAQFSGYDMNTTGACTVTVSYTEGDVTKTAEYALNVYLLKDYTMTFTSDIEVTDQSTQDKPEYKLNFSADGVYGGSTYKYTCEFILNPATASLAGTYSVADGTLSDASTVVWKTTTREAKAGSVLTIVDKGNQKFEISGIIVCKDLDAQTQAIKTGLNYNFTTPGIIDMDPFKLEPAEMITFDATANKITHAGTVYVETEEGVTPISITASVGFDWDITLLFNVAEYAMPAGSYSVSADGTNGTIQAADGQKGEVFLNPSVLNVYEGWDVSSYFITGGALEVAYVDDSIMHISGALTSAHGSTINVDLTMMNPFYVAPAAPALNIYASGLKLNDGKISYLLNAPATALQMLIMNGEDVVKTIDITDAAALTMGQHNDVAVDVSDITAAGTYTWALKASAAATEEMTLVSDESNRFNFYTPTGMAVDNSMESPFFGRIYVVESREGKSTENGRITHEGVYIFSADLEDVTNQGDNAYGGGVIWGENTGKTDGSGFSYDMYGPARMAVAENGDVFITDNVRASGVPTTTGVWMMDPANPSADFVEVLDQNAFGTTFNRVNSIALSGNGADRVMYTIDWCDSIVSYPVGECATPYAGPMTAVVPNLVNYGIGNALNTLARGKDGDFWIFQWRGQLDEYPIVTHFNVNGVRDFFIDKNNNASLAAATNPCRRGAGAISPDGSKIAWNGDKKMYIYDVAYDQDGVPSLSNLQTIATASNVDAIGFDVAGNLYFASAAVEYFYAYAMPKADNSFITNAPVAQAIVVKGTGTNLNEVKAGMKAVKVMRNGHVFIIRDGKMFNMQGMMVK